jgi:uncharacterized membrane protein SpoIIM required for sporulation
METIHNITNNHPIITIIIIGFIVGIVITIVALKNAKELDEQVNKTFEKNLKKAKDKK